MQERKGQQQQRSAAPFEARSAQSSERTARKQHRGCRPGGQCAHAGTQKHRCYVQRPLADAQRAARGPTDTMADGVCWVGRARAASGSSRALWARRGERACRKASAPSSDGEVDGVGAGASIPAKRVRAAVGDEGEKEVISRRRVAATHRAHAHLPYSRRRPLTRGDGAVAGGGAPR